WLYFDKHFNWSRYFTYKYFPKPDSKNLVICVSGIGASKEFSAFIVDIVPNVHFLDSSQCFPLRYYQAPDEEDEKQLALHKADGGWRENVSGYALEKFRAAYKDQNMTGEDIF